MGAINEDWRKLAERFEKKTSKFMHSSRRLNILANDMLRYMNMCESVTHLAREGYAIKGEYITEMNKLKAAPKEAKKAHFTHKLKIMHLLKRIKKVYEAFEWRTKELKKIEKIYKEHIDAFSKALKA